jgi:hypothetical protein
VGFGKHFKEAREGFVERMQRYFIRYELDIPGVLVGAASFVMVGLALVLVVHSFA